MNMWISVIARNNYIGIACSSSFQSVLECTGNFFCIKEMLHIS